MFLDNEEEIFNQWNNVKKRTQEKIVTAYFREREIYWANLGKNIGYEQQLEKVAFFIILIFWMIKQVVHYWFKQKLLI